MLFGINGNTIGTEKPKKSMPLNSLDIGFLLSYILEVYDTVAIMGCFYKLWVLSVGVQDKIPTIWGLQGGLIFGNSQERAA